MAMGERSAALEMDGGWIGVRVPGDPVAWERVVRTTAGRGRVPPRTRQAKRDIGWEIKAAWTGIEPAEDLAFGLQLRFFCPDRRRRDLDNLIKLTMDALTGIVYRDDTQVQEIDAQVVRHAPRPYSEIAWRVVGTYPAEE